MKKKFRKIKYGRVSVTENHKGSRIRWRENNKNMETTSPCWDKACSIAKEVDARLEAGGPGNPRMTMAALVAAATERTEYPNYSDEAWNNLRSLVRNHIVPKFENQRATSVKRSDLQNFLNGLLLKDQLSKFTVSKIRAILVRAGHYGEDLGLWTTTKNPAKKIQVLRSSAGDVNDVQLHAVPLERIPSEEEVRRLLDVAWEARPLHGFILEMAARSGLRWSEIMGLMPSDFDFENRTLNVERARRELPDGTVIVKPTKTKAGTRMAIISKVSVKRVRAFVESQPANEFICRSASGGIVRKTHFVKPLNRYKAAANFPSHLTTHSLRHYFGTYGLRAGVKLVDMSRIIGHANPNTTLTLYVHGDPESVERSKAFL